MRLRTAALAAVLMAVTVPLMTVPAVEFVHARIYRRPRQNKDVAPSFS